MTNRKDAISKRETTYQGKPCKKGHTLKYTSGRHCVECSKLKGVNGRKSKRDFFDIVSCGPQILDYLKICTACKLIFPLANFYKHKHSKKGYTSQCKQCTLCVQKTNLNTQRKREQGKRYYIKNKSHVAMKNKEWSLKNPEKSKAIKDRWWKNNRGKVNAQTAKRHASKITQTPEWANLSAIKQIYIECHEISKETGIKHHVDHIVPLRGKLVSGLHVENNLRIIPAVDNMSKNNKLVEGSA